MLMHPLLTAPPHPLQENHHCASAFKLMREDQYNWLKQASPKVGGPGDGQCSALAWHLSCTAVPQQPLHPGVACWQAATER